MLIYKMINKMVIGKAVISFKYELQLYKFFKPLLIQNMVERN